MFYAFLSTDTTPPNVQCPAIVMTNSDSPNIFHGLTSGTEYNASDISQPLSMSYNPTEGSPSAGGNLFPPGDTLVTLSVTDAEGNTATCIFTVINQRKSMAYHVRMLCKILRRDQGFRDIHVDRGQRGGVGRGTTGFDFSAVLLLLGGGGDLFIIPKNKRTAEKSTPIGGGGGNQTYRLRVSKARFGGGINLKFAMSKMVSWLFPLKECNKICSSNKCIMVCYNFHPIV